MKVRVLFCIALLKASEAYATGPELVLHFELLQQLPVMKVRIDGLPASLILDLGGFSTLALRPDWANSPADGKELPRRLEVVANRVETISSNVWMKSSIPSGIDGYLGYGYLQNYSFVIDYAKLEIRLYRQGESHSECQAKSVMLKQLGSLPYLHFEREGRPLLLGLDSGANQNVLKRGALGINSIDSVVPLESITLDGHPINLGAFRTINLPIPLLDGLLGYNFFARYRVCLDPAARAVSVDAFNQGR